MIQGNGTLTIKTTIRRKDGKIEEETADYKVKNGDVKDGNIRRQRD